jgi:hypothetical protein
VIDWVSRREKEREKGKNRQTGLSSGLGCESGEGRACREIRCGCGRQIGKGLVGCSERSETREVRMGRSGDRRGGRKRIRWVDAIERRGPA